jgi:hypothetical protein
MVSGRDWVDTPEPTAEALLQANIAGWNRKAIIVRKFKPIFMSGSLIFKYIRPISWYCFFDETRILLK